MTLRPELILAALLALAVPAWADTRPLLTGNLNMYFRTDGADANDCTADDAAHACLLDQALIDRAEAWDFGGNIITLQAGNEGGPKTFYGHYDIGSIVGGGALQIIGRGASQTILNGQLFDIFHLNDTLGRFTLGSMKLTNSGGSGLINVLGLSIFSLGSGIEFGYSPFSHVFIHDRQAKAYLLNTTYTISAPSALRHLYASAGSIFLENSTVNLVGGPNFPSGFAVATNGAYIQSSTTTFVGAATGVRYAASLNSVINSFTGGNPNYFPGNAAGTVSSGGQYQ